MTQGVGTYSIYISRGSRRGCPVTMILLPFWFHLEPRPRRESGALDRLRTSLGARAKRLSLSPPSLACPVFLTISGTTSLLPEMPPRAKKRFFTPTMLCNPGYGGWGLNIKPTIPLVLVAWRISKSLPSHLFDSQRRCGLLLEFFFFQRRYLAAHLHHVRNQRDCRTLQCRPQTRKTRVAQYHISRRRYLHLSFRLRSRVDG